MTRGIQHSKKNVSFAAACDITFIERIDQPSLWYTDDEFEAMQKDQARDVNMACLRLYAKKPDYSYDDAKVSDLLVGEHI